jgi:hypothetical protein
MVKSPVRSWTGKYHKNRGCPRCSRLIFKKPEDFHFIDNGMSRSFMIQFSGTEPIENRQIKKKMKEVM